MHKKLLLTLILVVVTFNNNILGMKEEDSSFLKEFLIPMDKPCYNDKKTSKNDILADKVTTFLGNTVFTDRKKFSQEIVKCETVQENNAICYQLKEKYADLSNKTNNWNKNWDKNDLKFVRQVTEYLIHWKNLLTLEKTHALDWWKKFTTNPQDPTISESNSQYIRYLNVEESKVNVITLPLYSAQEKYNAINQCEFTFSSTNIIPRYSAEKKTGDELIKENNTVFYNFLSKQKNTIDDNPKILEYFKNWQSEVHSKITKSPSIKFNFY